MKVIITVISIITALSLVTVGCAKKVIDPGPYDRPSGSSAAGSGVEGPGVQEESLAETGDRSRMLSARAAAELKAFENQDILFEFDSAVLTATAQEILRDKARWLESNPKLTVIIEGHCDDRGTNEYNLALGEKRAQSTQNYLVTLGIDSSRLNTVSYGEERPLVAGTSEEAREKNRRAHFVIER